MFDPFVVLCDVKGFPFLENSVKFDPTSFVKFCQRNQNIANRLAFYFFQNEKKSEFLCI